MYAPAFANNHITGQNILDLTEEDLTEDLGFTLASHRTNFMKGQSLLKKIDDEQIHSLGKNNKK